MASIFSTDNTTGQPQGISYAKYLGMNTSSYFFFSEDNRQTLTESMGLDTTFVNTLIEEGMWKVIINNYTENHTEGLSLTNTLSESFSVAATGAMPLQISLSGVLYTTSTEDYRLDFLKIYNNLFRGTVLQKYNIQLNFIIKNTFLKLCILNFVLGTSSNMDDMTQFSLSALGYNYTIPYNRSV